MVLRAPAGTKVWSAGHDVSELPSGGRDPLGWSDPLRVLIREAYQDPSQRGRVSFPGKLGESALHGGYFAAARYDEYGDDMLDDDDGRWASAHNAERFCAFADDAVARAEGSPALVEVAVDLEPPFGLASRLVSRHPHGGGASLPFGWRRNANASMTLSSGVAPGRARMMLSRSGNISTVMFGKMLYWRRSMICSVL